MYLEQRNWDAARRYYRMAADRMNVYAICGLAREASLGYFQCEEITQEDHRRQPDLEEAFRLYQEGARLGDAACCERLGHCYVRGRGTEEDHAKGFKWFKKAAEKDDVVGMSNCANCYLYGRGVEQSNEHAIYWYEKYLELEDNDVIRSVLQELRGQRTGDTSL